MLAALGLEAALHTSEEVAGDQGCEGSHDTDTEAESCSFHSNHFVECNSYSQTEQSWEESITKLRERYKD